jgi:hypothetical protein
MTEETDRTLDALRTKLCGMESIARPSKPKPTLKELEADWKRKRVMCASVERDLRDLQMSVTTLIKDLRNPKLSETDVIHLAGWLTNEDEHRSGVAQSLKYWKAEAAKARTAYRKAKKEARG